VYRLLVSEGIDVPDRSPAAADSIEKRAAVGTPAFWSDSYEGFIPQIQGFALRRVDPMKNKSNSHLSSSTSEAIRPGQGDEKSFAYAKAALKKQAEALTRRIKGIGSHLTALAEYLGVVVQHLERLSSACSDSTSGSSEIRSRRAARASACLR